jgi:hypothetical protein
MLGRRLRAIGISMALWAVPWTVFGLILGIVARLGFFGEVHVRAPFQDVPLIVAAVLVGLVTGLLNGLIFALLLMVAERGRGIGALRSWRFAIWGGIASGATGAASSQNAVIAAIFAAVGAAGGLLALALAKAGAGNEPAAADIRL